MGPFPVNASIRRWAPSFGQTTNFREQYHHCRFAPRTDHINPGTLITRSEEHTSELQSRLHLVCRLLLEKKTTISNRSWPSHPKKNRSIHPARLAVFCSSKGIRWPRA